MHRASLIASASLLAIIPATAQSQGSDGIRKPISVCGRCWCRCSIQPKYPGSDDYILVPLPLVAVQRLFIPGFGQVVDGEEELRAFYMFPSFDFNGERRAVRRSRTDRD